MKVVCLSDTHCRHSQISVPNGDLLIHAGDISNGAERDIRDFLAWFTALPHLHKILVAGNMDFDLEKNFEVYADDLEDIVYLENDSAVIEEYMLYGSPVVPNFIGVFNRNRGEEIKKYWDRIPDDVDILITHGPPLGILDETSLGHHVGCQDLLNSLSRVRPRLHLFGHIHESYGVLERDGTTFVNASFGNGNSPVVVNLD
ncbi:MAG: metallophosphatase domain-containing protein [Saprospiraceae bacterium]|nr:metallophosphatase domain-containing protein [Saprospiraceae bacterium]